MSSNFSHAARELEILLLAQHIELFGVINRDNRNAPAVVNAYDWGCHCNIEQVNDKVKEQNKLNLDGAQLQKRSVLSLSYLVQSIRWLLVRKCEYLSVNGCN